MIFRVDKTKDYTVMSNYHLREKEMSLKAKGLLSWMLSNDDDWDYSIQGIVACCKENETAIESALNELKQFGYLTITKLFPNETESGRFEYIYNIHEKPVQGVEKQGVENLPLEIQPVENQVQRNIKERSTKERNTKEENIILKNNTAEPFQENDLGLNNSEKPKRRVLMNDDFSSKAYSSEKEEKQKEKKLSMFDKCRNAVDEYTTDEELRQALKNYLIMRLKITGEKQMKGPNQWKGMLNKLTLLNGDKIKIVTVATAEGWASFHEVNERNEYKNTYNKPNRSTFGETEAMTNLRPNEVEGGQFSGLIF